MAVCHMEKVCPLVHSQWWEKEDEHKDTLKHTQRETENKPSHFQLNHVKRSVNCNAAAESSLWKALVWKEQAAHPHCINALIICYITEYLHPNTPCVPVNLHWAAHCCNERLCREGGNHLGCCRENVSDDNLQPRACETDAGFSDKPLFFQLPPPHSLALSLSTSHFCNSPRLFSASFF